MLNILDPFFIFKHLYYLCHIINMTNINDMIQFKYPIFVKSTSDSLVKELEKLGYTTNTVKSEYSDCIMTGSNLGHYLYMNSESFYETNPHHTWNCARRVDCGKNETLAIAIAAINDENDYMQWFKHNTKNDWIKVHEQSFNDIHYNVTDYHKATVEELINFLN